MRNQVMPGGRIRWIVTRKLIAVKIELNPRIIAPRVIAVTAVFVVVLYGV